MLPIELPHTRPCRFSAKSPLMIYGSGSPGRELNTVVHGGAREFRTQRGRVYGRGYRGNGGRTSNGNNSSSNNNKSNGDINSNGNSHGGSSAGSAQGVRGRSRGNKPSGRCRGRGQDTGQNHRGRCRSCHNSTNHGWQNSPLRLSHDVVDATKQANVVQESAAWFTRVQVNISQLEDFAIGIGDDTQVQKAVPAAV